MVFSFLPNCVVKNPDIVGGIVEVEAGPKIGKISWVCIHSNNLRQEWKGCEEMPKVKGESKILKDAGFSRAQL